MQLHFRDLALQAEDEPVVGVGRVVDAVLVGQQGAEEAADLQQVVPVLAGSGEPAHLQAQDQPDVVHGDLGQQALETEPGVGGAAALPEVLVDDEDPLGGPAQGAGMLGQGILAGERLAVLDDLLRAWTGGRRRRPAWPDGYR